MLRKAAGTDKCPVSICYSAPVVVTLVSPVPGTTPGPGHMLSAHLSDELHKTTIGSEPHDKGGQWGWGHGFTRIVPILTVNY